MKNKNLEILNNFLLIAPFDGFSDFSIKEAAKQAGIDNNELKIIFPSGIKNLVDFFYKSQESEIKEYFDSNPLTGLRIPEKIEKIILFRLTSWNSKKEAIKRLIAFQSLLWNVPQAMKNLYNTIDSIWNIAEDSSSDFSFYTKRVILSGVYTSTVLFWLNDNSPDMVETKLFLQRRLQNVAEFGKFKKKITACLK
ncbi:MAG: COQ9 family protein [Pseudomonadota bacterium]